MLTPSILAKGLLDVLEALKDCSEGVQRTALMALVNLGRADTAEALGYALAHSAEKGEPTTAWTLARFTTDSTPPSFDPTAMLDSVEFYHK